MTLESGTALNITRHRRLLIALLVIIVGVLFGLARLVRPRAPEALTLHIKIVENGIVRGRRVIGFLVEGPDRYELEILSVNYLRTDRLSNTTTAISEMALSGDSRARYFTVPEDGSDTTSAQACKLQVDVWVLAPHAKNQVRKLFEVTSDTWRFRKRDSSRSRFSLAKEFWKSGRHIVSEQTILSEVITNAAAKQSDVITNAPLIQFPSGDF